MRLIYIGVALVIGGAMTMLASYHVGGPPTVTEFGKILAVLGFAVYVVGRVRYRRKGKADLPSETSHREEKS